MLIPTASGAPASRSVSTAASSASRPLAITATLAPSAARVSRDGQPHALAAAGDDGFGSVEAQVHRFSFRSVMRLVSESE